MKNLTIALRMMIVLTLLVGVIYPVVMTLAGQGLFKAKARGSLVYNSDEKIVGSSLIAQGFKGEKYFWPRPSFVDYNPMPSGGSNLGPTSRELQAKVTERKKQGFTDDQLFTSGSGLDPHISPESAQAQVERIAQARGVSHRSLQEILDDFTESPQFDFLGDARVNVLLLNLALDERLGTDGLKK
jgi:K+-transporting ATPase ATPase C chain